jgi:hypothetical protein
MQFKASIAFLRMGWDWVHLIRRPLISLLCQPWIIDDECGAVGGMRIGRGNRSTRRKPTSVPICPPQIPHNLTWARTLDTAGLTDLVTVTTDGQSILMLSPHMEPKTRFLLLTDWSGFDEVGRPLWREGGYIVYNCSWPSNSAFVLGSESRGTHDQIRDSPNLEDQAPIFISPRNKLARLYPQAPGSLFIASYDSQGYGGGIRPRLHTG